jgi:hypothetical protein
MKGDLTLIETASTLLRLDFSRTTPSVKPPCSNVSVILRPVASFRHLGRMTTVGLLLRSHRASRADFLSPPRRMLSDTIRKLLFSILKCGASLSEFSSGACSPSALVGQNGLIA